MEEKQVKDFDQVIRLLEDYKKEYGDLLVPRSYTTENGVHLGDIVHSMRSGRIKTSENEKAMLNKLGFVWKIRESSLPFEEVIKLLKEYREQYGNLLVPKSYIAENGIHLGDIVHSIRRGNRKTSEEEKEILDSIGFIWNKKNNFNGKKHVS